MALPRCILQQDEISRPVSPNIPIARLGSITGPADDGPSGIATDAQAGAVFGHGRPWLVRFTRPFTTVVRQMRGRRGRGVGGALPYLATETAWGTQVTAVERAVLGAGLGGDPLPVARIWAKRRAEEGVQIRSAGAAVRGTCGGGR